MKVVVASTPEQESHINELIDYMYSSIFPVYFDTTYLKMVEEMNVLAPKEEDLYYNQTLDKAFKVISSLQAMIAVLDTVRYEGFQEEHQEIFNRNAKILNEYGYFFPFTPEEFKTLSHIEASKFSKPVQRYLA